MIARDLYLSQIMQVIDTPVIKVITGVRRSGKSTLLQMMRQHLMESGRPASNILYFNFESLANEPYTDYRSLYEKVVSDTSELKGKVYLFFDEIQEVEAWEKAIRSFMVDIDCDVYITGSNAQLLSTELATYLSGRTIEFMVYPLSYGEHLDFKEKPRKPSATLFEEYIRYGGFPGLHQMKEEAENKDQYIKGIYNTVILKDVVQRNNIRESELLERILHFLMDNVGNTVSAKKIADFLKSQGRRFSTETVYQYLDALCNALIVHKVKRFDIKGKKILETQEKYYLSDVGLKHAMLGYRRMDIPGILENLVYLEAKRRGYEVSIGKSGSYEVDFVCVKKEQRLYIQVAYLLASDETIEREFRSLRAIHDQYPKYVVSMDALPESNVDGIKRLHIEAFLLNFPE